MKLPRKRMKQRHLAPDELKRVVDDVLDVLNTFYRERCPQAGDFEIEMMCHCAHSIFVMLGRSPDEDTAVSVSMCMMSYMAHALRAYGIDDAIVTTRLDMFHDTLSEADMLVSKTLKKYYKPQLHEAPHTTH